MKMIKTLIVGLLVAWFIGSGITAHGQEASKEEQEMMKKMAAFATPGPNHKYLESFTGDWTAEVKMWMQPGQPPVTTQYKMTSEMIMGGRYFHYHVKGSFMGMPFEGKSIIGYDNFKKKFVSMWIDNMGTGIYMTEGTLDKTGKVRTETGLWDDIATGGKVKVKMVTKSGDKDKFLFEMYYAGGMYGPKEVKAMEIAYTRKK